MQTQIFDPKFEPGSPCLTSPASVRLILPIFGSFFCTSKAKKKYQNLWALAGQESNLGDRAGKRLVAG